MRGLSGEEKQRIAGAVQEAEASTAGEIVTAVIPESSDYSARELLFAVAAGVVTQIILILLNSPITRLLDGLLWIESPILIPLSSLTVSLLTGSGAYALAQLPAVDRVIAGRRAMREAVRRRALRYFVESAAYDTEGRTGVLIFISLLERRVELIADRGINAAVEAGVWDAVVAELIGGIREKRIGDAVEKAVRAVGGVLAEHVPRSADDVNEIPDAPVELEGGS